MVLPPLPPPSQPYGAVHMGNIIPFRKNKVPQMPPTLTPEQLMEFADAAIKARETLLALQGELAVLRAGLMEIAEPTSETVATPERTGA